MSAPPSRPQPSIPRPLVVAVVTLAVIGLLPTWLTSWMGGLRGPLIAVLAPLSGPASSVASWLRTDAEPTLSDSPLDVQVLKSERDAYARRARALQAENESLRVLVRDLQRGVSYPRAVPTHRIEAKRIGRDIAAGTIDVNRGVRHGVSPGVTAVARRDEQLLGVVSRVSQLTAVVTPITERSLDPPQLKAVVIPERSAEQEDLASLPRCGLRPAGDGTLVDPQFPTPLDRAQGVSIGDIVRLDDEAWPTSAQMLVVGRIESIRPTSQPLFVELVVRPMSDLNRQRSLFLQVPDEAEVPER